MEHYFTNNENLKSELRTIIYKAQGHELKFYSDNGVFSKDKLDFGSTLLLETLYRFKQHENIDVLDVGCGYGFMGISLAKILGYNVTMVDVNKRALHLAEKNCLENKIEAKVLESKGINVSQKRVSRRMKFLGLRSIIIKKFNHAGKSNTDNTKEYPNLLEQDFFAEKPSQKWV